MAKNVLKPAGRVLPKIDTALINEIEEAAVECGLSTLEGQGNFTKAFQLSAGIQFLREKLTPSVMEQVMPLMNVGLGFRTDRPSEKNPKEYGVLTVRDCLIEAVLRGAYPVGNEFNIISKRPYFTKEYFERKVKEYPGLTDLELLPSVPKLLDRGALVTYRATWKVDGRDDRIEREIPIRVNAGMGADAILGKATRKILAAIYQRLTGSDASLPEGDVTDVHGGAVDTPVASTKTADQLAVEVMKTATGYGAGEPGSGDAPKPEKPEAPKGKAKDGNLFA